MHLGVRPCHWSLPLALLNILGGERLKPLIGGGGTTFPCVLWHLTTDRY